MGRFLPAAQEARFLARRCISLLLRFRSRMRWVVLYLQELRYFASGTRTLTLRSDISLSVSSSSSAASLSACHGRQDPTISNRLVFLVHSATTRRPPARESCRSHSFALSSALGATSIPKAKIPPKTEHPSPPNRSLLAAAMNLIGGEAGLRRRWSISMIEGVGTMQGCPGARRVSGFDRLAATV